MACGWLNRLFGREEKPEEPKGRFVDGVWYSKERLEAMKKEGIKAVPKDAVKPKDPA